MQPDSQGAPEYQSGLGGVYAICMRCGFKRRQRDIAKEWTNLLVCRDTCLDPYPPDMIPPRVWPEGIPIPDPAPRPPDIFVTPGPIDPDSL